MEDKLMGGSSPPLRCGARTNSVTVWTICDVFSNVVRKPEQSRIHGCSGSDGRAGSCSVLALNRKRTVRIKGSLTSVPFSARFPIFFQEIALFTLTPITPHRINADLWACGHVPVCTFIHIYMLQQHAETQKEKTKWSGMMDDLDTFVESITTIFNK